ncbi:MAG: 5-dehydro-2-deoxygluconokinase, partial [Roseibium sp.]|uniref:bifunctional 5-dehydro-2-deoxygluconokinase/5-dehydro-2- deoxyphosphogluconate aldolase n=1 Tax=Roseibium sp. TaxID=1936156 RepID=UPI003296F881
PTNMATGTARLGLKSGLITRVGNEHMGRFIREELERHGVDTGGVITDPDRLTALVLLGIRDQEQFPLIFYRENCADMALSEDDIDPAFIASAKAVVATGTHLSHPQTEAAVLKALGIARQNGSKTALDIDYRPNLWGLSGHGDGEDRFIASDKVTAKLQASLHLFDLIVGTEEEFHIAGGTTDTLQALRNVRAVSDATLVCKRGPMGAVAFEAGIPDSLDAGVSGPGFPIEVFNVLGAGDGFMSGLLKGWITGEDWVTALTYANACGAFAVSRHGCTPAYPSWEELQFFLKRGVRNRALRKDPELEQIHWSTNRHRTHGGDWSTMRVFAFDHRIQLEQIADEAGVPHERVGAFKNLCLDAALSVSGGQPGYGILCDSRLGREALYQAAGTGLWIGHPVEWPASRPLTLEPEIGPDFGGLAEWPAEHVVKVLCFYHPDDTAAMKAEQEDVLKRLFAVCRRNRLEMLLEVIPSKVGAVDDDTTAHIIRRMYDIGVYPDWWKLEPLTTRAAWANACEAITSNDPHTRGIVVLGLDAPEDQLAESFAQAAHFSLVKGFAVGRTIFADAARNWLAGRISNEDAVADMTRRFERLCRIWDDARAQTRLNSDQGQQQ